MRIVLGKAGANIVESACVNIPAPRDAVGATGLIESDEMRASLRQSLDALLAAARRRREAAVNPGA